MAILVTPLRVVIIPFENPSGIVKSSSLSEPYRGGAFFDYASRKGQRVSRHL
jgi:hypothetical protein